MPRVSVHKKALRLSLKKITKRVHLLKLTKNLEDEDYSEETELLQLHTSLLIFRHNKLVDNRYIIRAKFNQRSHSIQS